METPYRPRYFARVAAKHFDVHYSCVGAAIDVLMDHPELTVKEINNRCAWYEINATTVEAAKKAIECAERLNATL